MLVLAFGVPHIH